MDKTVPMAHLRKRGDMTLCSARKERSRSEVTRVHGFHATGAAFMQQALLACANGSGSECIENVANLKGVHRFLVSCIAWVESLAAARTRLSRMTLIAVGGCSIAVCPQTFTLRRPDIVERVRTD